MQIVRWIVGAALFLALLFLSLQNSDLVTLKFYHWWSWQAPLIFVVLIAFALGVAAGLLPPARCAPSRLKRELNRMQRAERTASATAARNNGDRRADLPDAAPVGRACPIAPPRASPHLMDFELWWLLPIPVALLRAGLDRRAHRHQPPAA